MGSCQFSSLPVQKSTPPPEICISNPTGSCIIFILTNGRVIVQWKPNYTIRYLICLENLVVPMDARHALYKTFNMILSTDKIDRIKKLKRIKCGGADTKDERIIFSGDFVMKDMAVSMVQFVKQLHELPSNPTKLNNINEVAHSRVWQY